MEMLNIPPAQPQTNPTAAPKGKTGKSENASFQNVLGKANQNAQNEQQKGSVNSTADEGTEFDGTSQLGDETAELSQPTVSVESEESSTEPDAEDTASIELTMVANPSLPVESAPAHKAEPALIVTESAKPADMTPLLSEANMPNTKAEVTSAVQETAETNATPAATSQDVSAQNAAPDVTNQSTTAKNVAPVTTDTAASMENTAFAATTTQVTAVEVATESLPIEKMNVADSTQPVELAQKKASAGSRQNTPIPTDAKSMTSQVMPANNPEQTGMASNETSKQKGLMESSLGNLLQEVRPLREQSRGRQAANLNRGDTPSIAIQTEESTQVVAGTQNEDSHPSFSSRQENGFSALQADAAANGTNSAINATPFEAVLEGGVHGSTASQQASQPLQATSAETGSIRLASGEFLSESQVVDQVLERISFDRAGNQSRIVVKMNPEELGEVKLALTMDKDQLRAQLLTQNHQVQEILEKHLPKLHEALSQQGVKLEDIQVDIDSNRHSGRESFANHQQPESFRRHFNAPAGSVNHNPVHPANASARPVSTQGLSLRI